eukprot:g15574.t1
MGMIPRGMREIARKRSKIDGRGTNPPTIGGGLAGMKFLMVVGAGGDGMGAGSVGTESSAAAGAVVPMAAGNDLPFENSDDGGGSGGGGGGLLPGEEEDESTDWESKSTFYKWGVPDGEANEKFQEKVKGRNGFRVAVRGNFDQNHMGILVERFKPFETFYHPHGPDGNNMRLCILRFATRKQMKAAVEHLPRLALEEGMEIDTVARFSADGGLTSGRFIAIAEATLSSMRDFEGTYPNIVRVSGLPVTPDTDVEDLERELFRRMRRKFSGEGAGSR